MAQIEASYSGKRLARVRKGTGKLRKRHCVEVKLGPSDRRARPLNGGALQPVQQRGCYTDLGRAKRYAEVYSKVPTLPRGSSTRSRRKGRKSRRSRR